MSGYLFQMPGGRADRHETLMKPIRPSEIVNAVERRIGKGGIGQPKEPARGVLRLNTANVDLRTQYRGPI
jgi:hypothetical protein